MAWFDVVYIVTTVIYRIIHRDNFAFIISYLAGFKFYKDAVSVETNSVEYGMISA
jgi:hypothetical protein